MTCKCENDYNMRFDMIYKEYLRNLIPPVMLPFIGKIYQKLKLENNTLYYDLENEIKSNPEISKLFPAERLKQHYVYEPVRQTLEHPDLFITQIRYYRCYKYFEEHYPESRENF